MLGVIRVVVVVISGVFVVHFVVTVVPGSVALITLLSLLGLLISFDLSVRPVVVSVSIKLLED